MTKSTIPSIEIMRYDMCRLHRSPQIWDNFRKSYKTYMGARRMIPHINAEFIRQIPEYAKELYQDMELAHLDMYSIWLSVKEYRLNRNK